jgi:hypothetical protein
MATLNPKPIHAECEELFFFGWIDLRAKFLDHADDG